MKNVTIPSQFLQELLALCGPEDHELRERVLKSAAPAHPAEGVKAQAATLPPLPEPTAFLVCKGSEVTARAWNVDQMRAYAAAALAATPPAAHPAEGVPATSVYAEARECTHCNHVGINDSAEGLAACKSCQWCGESPKEDKCPSCKAEGTMTASCPKCHNEYSLIASDTIAATQPAAQGLDATKLLAEKHTGMKVDYRGLLGQVRRAIKRTAGGHEEMLRQLEGHITELGQRWYAGDTAVVDELLQLYCVERQGRADLAAQAKQGGAA